METPDELNATKLKSAADRDALLVPSGGKIISLAPTGFVSRTGNRMTLVAAGRQDEFAFVYDAAIIAAVATTDYLFTVDSTGIFTCAGLVDTFPVVATDPTDDALQPFAPNAFAIHIAPHPTRPLALFVTEQQAIWVDFATASSTPLPLPRGSVFAFDDNRLRIFDPVTSTMSSAVDGWMEEASVKFTVPDTGAWKLAYPFGNHVAIITVRAILVYTIADMLLCSTIYITDPVDIVATPLGLVVATVLGELVVISVDKESWTMASVPAVCLFPCMNHAANSVIQCIGNNIFMFPCNTRLVYSIPVTDEVLL